MMKTNLKKAMTAILAVSLLLTGNGFGKAMGAAKEGVENAGAAKSTGWDTPRSGNPAYEAKKPVSGRIGTAGADKEKTEEGTGAEKPKQENDTPAEAVGFHTAKNYQELLDALGRNRTGLAHWGFHQYFTLDAADGLYGGTMDSSGAMMDAAGSEDAATGSYGKDYSDTNAQVEGIAEADIVKTDGEYIYILSRKENRPEVYIVQAEDGVLRLESSFSPQSSSYTYSWQEEMYVSGNRLVIVRQKDKEPETAAGSPEDDFYLDRWFGYYGRRQTQVLIYDITNRKAPVLLAEHVQDGDYVSSREKDGYLYVISEKGIYYNYIMYIDQVLDAQETGVPDVAKEGSLEGELSKEDCARLPQVDDALIAPDCIYFRDDSMDSVYTIVTAICLEEPEKIADSLSFVAESNHCYMSGNAIYLAAADWWNYGEKECDETDIVKIAYENGKLRLAAQGKVKGNLDRQFSMDEKDGYLRIVTTVNHYKLVQKADDIWQDYVGMSNSLYVLDADLKLVGSLENLAENEMIYSARFLGDIVYFVTFRNTDPLFSVDVSDPVHPVLLGALKIPGFSDYLHPYGENLLLGIGYDANEEGAVECVKLTMFDISDPRNVVEKHTLLLEDYSTSEACANHKAVLVDEERGLIGLPLEGDDYKGGGYWDYTQIKAYAVYGYDKEQGFYPMLEKKYTRDWENDWNHWYDMRLRGIYIGDDFYMVNPMKEVLSWQMGQEGFVESMALELK